MTYTYAVLEVSPAVYTEIEAKLREAGYDHAFHEGVIDMHGIALSERPGERPLPTRAEQEAQYRHAKAAFDVAYQEWKDGGRQGSPPPRPIPPHVPG